MGMTKTKSISIDQLEGMKRVLNYCFHQYLYAHDFGVLTVNSTSYYHDTWYGIEIELDNSYTGDLSITINLLKYGPE